MLGAAVSGFSTSGVSASSGSAVSASASSGSAAGSVSVRTRAGEDMGAMPFEDFLAIINEKIATKAID